MTPDNKAIIEEIIDKCGDCIYGMNIDASGKEMKRLFSELENSPLLKQQIATILETKDRQIAEARKEAPEDAGNFVDGLFQTGNMSETGFNLHGNIVLLRDYAKMHIDRRGDMEDYQHERFNELKSLKRLKKQAEQLLENIKLHLEEV